MEDAFFMIPIKIFFAGNYYYRNVAINIALWVLLRQMIFR